MSHVCYRTAWSQRSGWCSSLVRFSQGCLRLQAPMTNITVSLIILLLHPHHTLPAESGYCNRSFVHRSDRVQDDYSTEPVLRAVSREQVGLIPWSARHTWTLSLTDTHSIGEALIDTIDDLINESRIEPQLAMKILSNFDKAIADVLADKVKSRLTFKVW